MATTSFGPESRQRSLPTSWLLALAAAIGSLGACASSQGDEGSSNQELKTTNSCTPCLSDDQCGSLGVCAQFQSDIFCARPCPNGDECSGTETCTTVTTSSGEETDICEPAESTCGPSAGPSSPDATRKDAGPVCKAEVPTTSCGTLVGPSTKASCSGCGTHACQANGCYGGWWCDTSTDRCQAPPTTCGGGTGCDAGLPIVSLDAGEPDASGSLDAGGPPPVDGGGGGGISTIGENGGTASQLFFAVMGDTRPPVINDTKGYPTAIATEIYGDIAALAPNPLFVVATGDYMFATATGTQSSPQLDDYLGARAHYPGLLFPAMGNHECTGATTSNCGTGATDGITANYSAFLSRLLGPIHKTNPYYAINVDATDGSWSSKIVFVAGNAWDTAQATWLDTTLAQPTTYTFIVRHEPSAATTAPGVSPSEKIMAKHPYTLAIVGHTHTYGKTGARQVTIGNGGAPLTGGVTYGYGLVTQRPDKAVQVDMINYQTGAPDLNFRFALNPDGSAATP